MLDEDYSEKIEIQPLGNLSIFGGEEGEKMYVSLSLGGTLKINSGYAWDGPSGPTIDTPDFLIGSLVHDALYQLMRERKLPQSYRKIADQILKRICLEEGMPSWRAFYVYYAVRLFGASSAKPN